MTTVICSGACPRCVNETLDEQAEFVVCAHSEEHEYCNCACSPFRCSVVKEMVQCEEVGVVICPHAHPDCLRLPDTDGIACHHATPHERRVDCPPQYCFVVQEDAPCVRAEEDAQT